MNIDLTIQQASDAAGIPGDNQFELWISSALAARSPAVLTLRIVDREESRRLNSDYRHKDAPTNVLSFVADTPEFVDLPLLGDIVICAPLVAEQAAEQGKPAEAHWAHLCVHGVLHLLGYDHQQEDEAAVMESLETEILARLGFSDPYQPTEVAGRDD